MTQKPMVFGRVDGVEPLTEYIVPTDIRIGASILIKAPKKRPWWLKWLGKYARRPTTHAVEIVEVTESTIKTIDGRSFVILHRLRQTGDRSEEGI